MVGPRRPPPAGRATAAGDCGALPGPGEQAHRQRDQLPSDTRGPGARGVQVRPPEARRAPPARGPESRRCRRRGADARTPVYAMGDSNFDGLRLPGLTSAWEGRESDPGTLGPRRKIDDVFGPGPADSVRLLTSASDHKAVVVARRDLP